MGGGEYSDLRTTAAVSNDKGAAFYNSLLPRHGDGSYEKAGEEAEGLYADADGPPLHMQAGHGRILGCTTSDGSSSRLATNAAYSETAFTGGEFPTSQSSGGYGQHTNLVGEHVPQQNTAAAYNQAHRAGIDNVAYKASSIGLEGAAYGRQVRTSRTRDLISNDSYESVGSADIASDSLLSAKKVHGRSDMIQTTTRSTNVATSADPARSLVVEHKEDFHSDIPGAAPLNEPVGSEYIDVDILPEDDTSGV